MTPKKTVLFKYGGNAMTDAGLKRRVLENICLVKSKGYHVVIVHGGGPFIRQLLEQAGIKSEFIDGQRKTTPEAMEYVEMALKGKVNGSLVSIINGMGYNAVGISGKDGRTVIAEKRMHRREVNGRIEVVDMGQVGDVAGVDPALINMLLGYDFIPVITCVASDINGNDYNINGDTFAGHVAGAISAEQYIVLTDVDGLLLDIDDPGSMISEVRVQDLIELKEKGIIRGGMIPKIESCEIALQKGAGSARIINGTVPDQIGEIFENKKRGTVIRK